MNLRQLEVFRATMRGGSITAAAKLLHISQPSVSRLITDLEESLGFSLFTRTGHGIIASVEARRFNQSVDSMVIGLDKLRETAEAIRTTKDETVTLGVIPIFANSVMPEAVNDLRSERQGLNMDITVRNTPAIVDAVLLQQLDLGVICPTQRYEAIYIVYQTSVAYQCLLPGSHALADSTEAIDISALADEEFVTLDPAYLDQISNDKQLLQTLHKNRRIVARSDPAIASIARSTGIAAIVDPFTAKEAVKSGDMVALPIIQKLDYPIAIVARSADTLSLAASSLADALIRQFEVAGSIIQLAGSSTKNR